MKRAAAALALGGSLVLMIAGMAAGQTAVASSPARKFTLTFIERVREETSDNVTSLADSGTDSSACVRFRTSLGARWQPGDSFELGVRLTNEFRYYIAPKYDPRLGRNFGLNEVFFDHLYFKWKRPFGLPATVSLGRQDFQMGEGFIIMDGGPLDGSRSAYFNAARLDWAAGERATVTAFYVFQPRTDTILPVFHSVDQMMVEQAEEGYGVYAADASRAGTVEVYLFRKNIRAFDAAPASGITNIGGRVVWPLAESLSFTVEGALQSGTLGTVRRRGRGGYLHFDWKTGAAFPAPALLTLGSIYLSGDDTGTADRYEGWDPAFSRWPKWSESLIYLFARESKPAYWTNFGSIYGAVQFAFAPNARLALTWHRLSAPERSAPTALLSGTGRTRGDLGLAKLTYDITPNIQGHFLWEQFLPGDYYFAGAQSYAWVRFELLIRY